AGGPWAHRRKYESKRARQVAFWQIAGCQCRSAFEALAAISVPPDIAQSGQDYLQTRHHVPNPNRSETKALEFEAALGEWAIKHRIVASCGKPLDLLSLDWLSIAREWVRELARDSRVAWEIGLRKPLDTRPCYEVLRIWRSREAPPHFELHQETI